MTNIKVLSSYDYVTNPYNLNNFYGQPFIGDTPWAVPGTAPISTSKNWSAYGRLSTNPSCYEEELFQSRFFYRFDPTASTVINRMAELAARRLRIQRGNCTDEEYQYFNALCCKLSSLFSMCALEYLISGMAIPDYGTKRVMGKELHPSLGRKRYTVPDNMWTRNPENIVLRRVPFGSDRRVYLRIPPEESSFILNEGVYPDGTEDRELYATLVQEFPDYVQAIRDGKNLIVLDHVRPILRKIMPTNDYPQPFLVPALAALKHKLRIKEMDHSIATKALEAILHIKAGNDNFPVTEEDTVLDDLRTQMRARNANAADQLLYKLYTDHTVTIEYIYPELQALLTPQKYEAVDADIYMAMGFSRVLLVGESVKSNAGAGQQIILGPLAMLEELQERLLEWARELYEELADLNNFANTPTPLFDPLIATDAATLVTSASTALQAGVISKNTYAGFYGTDFETEQAQIELEVQTVAASPVIDQQVQLNQQKHTPPPTQPQGTPNVDGTTGAPPEPQHPSDTLGG